MRSFSRTRQGLSLLSLALLAGCAQPQSAGPAVVKVSRDVVAEAPSRLGINIGASYYWGDEQHVANPFAHGGFSEGRQVLLVQAAAGATEDTFRDAYFYEHDPDRSYEASFKGGEYCIATGVRAGEKGTIAGHDLKTGTYTLGTKGAPLAEQDVVWLRGPWVSRATPDPADPHVEKTIGIGDFRPLTESGVLVGLAPSGRAGHDQALVVSIAPGDGRKGGGVKHYVRSIPRDTYTVHVRAKADAPGMQLGVAMRNFGIPYPETGNTIELKPVGDATLTTEWQEYAFTCSTPDDPRVLNETSNFEIVASAQAQPEVLRAFIDAIWLEDAKTKSENGFSRPMAEALKEARCGTLRFYGVSSLGSLVEDFTAASTTDASWTFASLQSAGRFNATDAVLDEWMRLSKEVGADPWITVGSANTPEDWEHLISYLCAPADSDDYGKRRAAHGYLEPWSGQFGRIYLEIGNEWWNPVFRPFHIMPPEKYGELCRTILKAVKAHPQFDPGKINLVMGGWAANGHHWNGLVDKVAEGQDYLSIAPYLLQSLDDYASVERRFQALFADVEGYASDGGASTMADLKANGKGTRVAVYELNTHLTGGGAPASIASKICPTLGAGVAVLDQAMALMRDMGASPINYFTILQRSYDDRAGLWGAMLREADGSLRARPVWEGLRMANQSLIDGNMVKVEVSGGGAWDQPENGSVPALDGVPFVHAYAFLFTHDGAEGANVLVVNRDVSQSRDVSVSLPFEALPQVDVIRLGGESPEANNEEKEWVRLETSRLDGYLPGTVLPAAPSSATVYRFQGKK